MAKQFASVPEKTWHIDESVRDSRRRRLLSSIGYETIVKGLVREAEACDWKWETLRSGKGISKQQSYKYRRAVFTIAIAREIVDLFHNSCCGYRAQYYESPELGEQANKYAVNA